MCNVGYFWELHFSALSRVDFCLFHFWSLNCQFVIDMFIFTLPIKESRSIDETVEHPFVLVFWYVKLFKISTNWDIIYYICIPFSAKKRLCLLLNVFTCIFSVLNCLLCAFIVWHLLLTLKLYFVLHLTPNSFDSDSLISLF